MNQIENTGGSTLLQLRLRRSPKLTQRELALALDVTETTIRNWEKGREEPHLTFRQIKTLCRLLQCTLDELPDQVKLEG